MIFTAYLHRRRKVVKNGTVQEMASAVARVYTTGVFHFLVI